MYYDGNHTKTTKLGNVYMRIDELKFSLLVKAVIICVYHCKLSKSPWQNKTLSSSFSIACPPYLITTMDPDVFNVNLHPWKGKHYYTTRFNCLSHFSYKIFSIGHS